MYVPRNLWAHALSILRVSCVTLPLTYGGIGCNCILLCAHIWPLLLFNLRPGVFKRALPHVWLRLNLLIFLLRNYWLGPGCKLILWLTWLGPFKYPRPKDLPCHVKKVGSWNYGPGKVGFLHNWNRSSWNGYFFTWYSPECGAFSSMVL